MGIHPQNLQHSITAAPNSSLIESLLDTIASHIKLSGAAEQNKQPICQRTFAGTSTWRMIRGFNLFLISK
jgi:hypothetical protein